MPPPSGPKVPPSVGQAKFQEALQLHRAGRLDEAAGLYRYVAKHFPDRPDACHLQGLDNDWRPVFAQVSMALQTLYVG